MPGALTPSPIEPGSEASDPFLPMHWHPNFTAHMDQSQILPLSTEFVSLLSSDSIYLRDLPNASATTDIEWSDGTIEQAAPSTSPIPMVARAADEAAIEAAIFELGGAVCPKLNTACPTDAVWANIHRSTKCTTVDDVLTLVQASERALQTLSPNRGRAHLWLRRWASDFDPRQSFRLFVHSRDLVAVAHRGSDVLTVAFSDSRADAIVAKLAEWFTSVVRERFTEREDFVVDTRLDRTDRVILVDFAPWRQADPLLFEWEELEEAAWLEETGRPQFRASIRERVTPAPSAYSALPVELRGVEGMAELAGAAQRFVTEQIRLEEEQVGGDLEGQDSRTEELERQGG